MLMLKLWGIMILIGFLSAAYDRIKQGRAEVMAEDAERKRLLYEQLEREEEERQIRQEKQAELTKQLGAIQYQLQLLEKLDGFQSDTLANESDIKKALALEKQYNSLWIKERKLKRDLEKLEE